MSTTRRPWVGFVAVVGVTVVAATGCRPSAGASRSREADLAPPAPSGAEMLLTFEDSPGSGAVLPGPRDLGTAPSQTRVRTSGGGRVVADQGPDGLVGRFPAVGGPNRPLAVVVVVPTEPDRLSPGEDDFSFGADVVLDEVSEGPGDNGDNVLQRGLFADAVQYKLQLDHGRPSCRLAGAGGTAVAKADAPVTRGRWYRLRCRRHGDELVLEVRAWRGDSWGDSWADSTRTVSRRPVGAMSFDRTDGTVVPLSVGGKVGADGRIPDGSSDLLNGAVDNVFVDVLPDGTALEGGSTR
ncbi:hypothetical protein [Nocardioides plantarum]|uniref:Concanavalin A-like lectin/glucanase superfamily protein n=1 Tax=Nocardioides plantarum TaxID=29299 RepID=A0ABV5KB69_9ACTN|nr:hypothetical protein [Nocardioides plantarum]